MSNKNFSESKIASDGTIKYLKSIKDELIEKTKIQLDMIDNMIAKRTEEIRKESITLQAENTLIHDFDFSNTSCPKAIMKIISENKKSLSAKEIADKLLQNGYKTDAKDFEKIVYNRLYNSLKKKGLVQKQGDLWSLTD